MVGSDFSDEDRDELSERDANVADLVCPYDVGPWLVSLEMEGIVCDWERGEGMLGMDPEREWREGDATRSFVSKNAIRSLTLGPVWMRGEPGPGSVLPRK